MRLETRSRAQRQAYRCLRRNSSCLSLHNVCICLAHKSSRQWQGPGRSSQSRGGHPRPTVAAGRIRQEGQGQHGEPFVTRAATMRWTAVPPKDSSSSSSFRFTCAQPIILAFSFLFPSFPALRRLLCRLYSFPPVWGARCIAASRPRPEPWHVGGKEHKHAVARHLRGCAQVRSE